MTLNDFFIQLKDTIENLFDCNVVFDAKTQYASTVEIIDKKWIRILHIVSRTCSCSGYRIHYCDDSCVLDFHIEVGEGMHQTLVTTDMILISAMTNIGEYDIAIRYWTVEINMYGEEAYSFENVIDYVGRTLRQIRCISIIIDNIQELRKACDEYHEYHSEYEEMYSLYSVHMLYPNLYLESDQIDHMIEACDSDDLRDYRVLLLRYKHDNLLNKEDDIGL